MTSVVAAEASGIQEWIVSGATELKVVRGGSLLLEREFEDAFAALVAEFGEPREPSGDGRELDAGWWDQVRTSGAMTLVFADDGEAERAARLLDSHLRPALPGLPLRLGHAPFGGEVALVEARRTALFGRDMAVGTPDASPDDSLPPSRTTGGLPGRYVLATRMCDACGTASCDVRRNEARDDIRWCRSCNERAAMRPSGTSASDSAASEGGRISHDMGEIGEATVSSRYGGYVGIVCADGNAFGRLFHEASTPKDFAVISQRIKAATNETVRQAVARAVSEHERVRSGGELPYNPVVFGGDDLCFVFPAHVALPAAAALCEPIDGLSFSASVLLCHASLPFWLGHEYAQGLLDEAKAAGRLRGSETVPAAHVAFHVETGSAPSRARTSLSASPYRASTIQRLLDAAETLRRSPSSQLRNLQEALLAGGRIAERGWELATVEMDEPERSALSDLPGNLEADADGPWITHPLTRTVVSPLGDVGVLRLLGTSS